MVDKRAENRRRKKQTGPVKQQRSWFLPAVAVVVAAGVTAVGALAFTREPDTESNRPGVGDHWHLAYGVYACDTYLQASTDQTDPLGIHSHGDGLIHVHPYRVEATGKGATLARFTDAIGAQLSDDRYTPGPGEPDGRVLSEDEGCDGQPSDLVLAYWPDATQAGQPELIREDLADFRLSQDGSALAIALVPEGTTDIPLPPFLTQLQNPVDT